MASSTAFAGPGSGPRNGSGRVDDGAMTFSSSSTSSSALSSLSSSSAAARASKRKRFSELDDEEQGYVPGSVPNFEQGESEDDVNPKDLPPEYFKKRTRHIPELSRKEFPLQVGHEERPLWILPEDPRRRDKTVGGRIILESFSPYYQASYEFMVAIAEPVSRPTHVHEWQLTVDSLYSAVACGISVDTIIKTLRILSKTALHGDVEAFVRNSVKLVGKVRRVLKLGKYYVESSDRKLLARLRYKFANMPQRAGKVSQAVVNWEKIDRLLQARDKLRDANGGSMEWELDLKDQARQEAKSLVLAQGIGPDQTHATLAMRSAAAKQAYEECDRAAPIAMSGPSAGKIGYDPKETEFARAAEDLAELGIRADGFYEARRQALEESQDKTLSDVMDLEERLMHDEENENAREVLAQREKEARDMSGGRDGNGDAGSSSGRNSKMYAFEIELGRIKDCTQCAKDVGIPMLEEYEYLKDELTPSLKISLKGHAKIRDYQRLALNKMFSHSRSRSGIIVLPCGSGKTIVGITAAVTIKKSCLCLVTGGVSVEQWKAQFEHFTNIDPKLVCRFTAAAKDPLPPDGKPCICITSYHMISFSGRRSRESENYMAEIKSRDWGLLLLDEVHVCPAKIFRRTLEMVRAHTTLGLTATLVREDDLIKDLSFLLGPKLYEANWMDLTSRGFLAKVLCSEVWCPMTTEFYSAYLSPKTNSKHTVHRLQQRIFVLNPNKVAACRELVDVHKKRGDKILVFSDDIFALKRYAELLQVPMLYGDTPAADRLQIISGFKTSPTENVICISSVGDTSIDLPECAVIIQVASHFGARRQEAQRLGRVLRPKAGPQLHDGYNAYFYSLVSTETREMYFAHRRQRYLQDQGYTYKILTRLLDWEHPDIENKARDDGKPVFLSQHEQKALLIKLLDEAVSKDDVNQYDQAQLNQDEEHDGDYAYFDSFQESGYVAPGASTAAGAAVVRRAQGNGFQSLSGGTGMAYAEVDA